MRILAALLIVGYVALFLSGFALSNKTFNAATATVDECRALANAKPFRTPCEIAANVSTTTYDVKNISFLPAQSFTIAICGAIFNVIVTVVLFLRYRGSNQTFLSFVKHSTKVELLQVVVAAVSAITSIIIFSNAYEWTDKFLLTLDPNLNESEWLDTLRLLICSSHSHIFVVYLVSEYFATGALTSSCVLYTIAHEKINSNPKQQMRARASLDVRIYDGLYTMCSAWTWYFSRKVPAIRMFSLFLFASGFRMLRFSRVIDGLSTIGTRIEMTKLSERLRRQWLLLSLTLLKSLLYFLASSMFMMGLEGFPCEYYSFPEVVSPCECDRGLRESVGSLYFVFTTATTVGFGDLTPRTSIGRLYVIVFMVIGITVLPGWCRQIFDGIKDIADTRRAMRQARQESMLELQMERIDKEHSHPPAPLQQKQPSSRIARQPSVLESVAEALSGDRALAVQLDALSATNAALLKQLEVKDQQIAKLQDLLNELQKTLNRPASEQK